MRRIGPCRALFPAFSLRFSEAEAPGLAVVRPPEYPSARRPIQPMRGVLDLCHEARAPGEVTEWPKVHDWKSCVPARVPRVPSLGGEPPKLGVLMFPPFAVEEDK